MSETPARKKTVRKPAAKKTAKKAATKTTSSKSASVGKKAPAAARPRRSTKAAPEAAPAARSPDEAAREFAILSARTLAEQKCDDIVVLDVRERSPVTYFIVIASGTSDRQMRSAGEHVDDAGKAAGFPVYRSNLKSGASTWYVLDFSHVFVHIFEPQQRLYYDMEMLWGDAPRVAWQLEGKPAAPRGAR